MKVHIHKRSGKFVSTLDLPAEASADDLKQQFYEKCRFYPERQWFNVGSAKGPVLKSGSLSSNGVQDESSLYFKDLGVQISWRLVFVLEYLGPLVIIPVFWCFPSLFYHAAAVDELKRSTTQRLAIFLLYFHFLKREVESLFVHRFSNATMPLVRLPINCVHYWLLCGASIGYFLCHPKYSSIFEGSLIIYPLAALFLVFEVLNFKTHLILRNLRPRGTKIRGLPTGYGFQWVSCANYFWETCAWVVFSILTMCLTSYIFTVIAFAQMTVWALKKRSLYRLQFPEYPRSRKSIVPLLI